MLLMGRSTNINIYQLFLWPFSIAFCMFTRPGIINHKCDLQPPGANPKAKLGQYPAVDPRRCLKRSWSMKKLRSNSLPHEFRCTREHTKIALFWTWTPILFIYIYICVYIIYIYIYTWWFIPVSKWIITPVISELTLLSPVITRGITYLLTGGEPPSIYTYSCIRFGGLTIPKKKRVRMVSHGSAEVIRSLTGTQDPNSYVASTRGPRFDS